MTSAFLTPSALEDFLEIVDWLANENPQSAENFRNAVESSAEHLGQYPHIGSQKFEIADPPTRFFVLKDFPYILVYDGDQAPPAVLRILHGARDLPELFEDR